MPDYFYYFQVLGLPNGASRAEVDRAYRRLALTWHRDRNPDAVAVIRMQEINFCREQLEKIFRGERPDPPLSFGHQPPPPHPPGPRPPGPPPRPSLPPSRILEERQSGDLESLQRQ